MVLISPEDVTINGITLSTHFDGGGGYFVVNEVIGRDIAPKNLNLISALGQDGAHYLGSTLQTRPLQIRFTMKGNSFDDLRKRMEDLNGILKSNEVLEIQFADEPDRFYYGVVNGGTEELERSKIHQGSIDIIRPDPYKYGAEVRQDFVNGAATVENVGVYETYPRFVFNVLNNITFLDLVTQDAYMRIGQPSDVDTTPIEAETLAYNDLANTTMGWAAATTIEQGTVSGAIASNGYTFRASDFGYGTGWHGPAIQRSIPNAPFNDFVVEVGLIMNNPTNKHIGRVVIELLDTNGKVIARMNVNKQTESALGNKGAAFVGNTANHFTLFDTWGPNNNAYKNFNGILRIAKRGNAWSAYIAQVDPDTKRFSNGTVGQFTDANGAFNAALAQVRLHFGVYGSRTPAPMYIDYLKVWEVNEVVPNAAEIIARQGDVIEINHQNDLILINGQPRIDLKDFGASYFPLKSNSNVVIVEPSENVEGFLTYRERFL